MDNVEKTFAYVTTALGIVGTLGGLYGSYRGYYNKQAQQGLETRQKAIEKSQQTFDALSKANTDAWPYLVRIMQPDTPPADVLRLAMTFPEQGYERARSILDGVKSLKEGRDMGAVDQAQTLLDTLRIQIKAQRTESNAREQGFRELQQQAMARVQYRNLVPRELTNLHGKNLLEFLSSREDKIAWLQGQLAKAAGPLFRSGDLQALVIQGLQLADQAQSPENRKLVNPLFVETIQGAANKAKAVLAKLDAATDEKSLNARALELIDIYSQIAPTIAESNRLSTAMIDKVDAMISASAPALDALGKGTRVPPAVRDGFERAYEAAIDAVVRRVGGEQIQGYKDRVNFTHSVVDILDSKK